MTTQTNHAEEQARAKVQSIMKMVAAMRCDYDRLEELRDERDGHEDESGDCATDATIAAWGAANPAEAEELADLETAAGECTSEDDARERIHEDALPVEGRTGWAAPGADPENFRILLCTSGPRVELVGELDRGDPGRVRVLYRDWGSSGEYFPSADERAAIEDYCTVFYFGE